MPTLRHGRLYSILFFCLLALDIAGMYIAALPWLHLLAKPLLMPLLMLYLWQNKKHSGEKTWKFIFAGLAASWAGDVLLMFQQQEIFFVLGLVCFLLTHGLYIVYFLRYKPLSYTADNWFVTHRFLSILVVGYAVILLALLMPHLGTMKIPVAIYTFVISLMLLQSMASKKRIVPAAYAWFVAGTVLFVVSDSVLAWNKFVKPFALSGLLVMLTYGMAQWLIVQGALRNTDPPLLPVE
jgi:uncharacterized membrane protein YhhN